MPQTIKTAAAIRSGKAFSLRTKIAISVAKRIELSRKAATSAIGATVIASTGAWAEVWTKAAIVSDPAGILPRIEAHGLAAMLVAADGSVTTTENWSSFTQ